MEKKETKKKRLKNGQCGVSVKKGSVLAYSLVLLAIMLSIGAALSLSTTLEKKSASSTEFSTQALQTADGGVQLALKKINEGIEASGGNTLLSSVFPGCAYSVTSSDTGAYNVYFYSDASGTTAVDCTTAKLKDVKNIKSVGVYKNTVRAVNVTVELLIRCGVDTVQGSGSDTGTYGTVLGPDGKCWLDRNLGAKPYPYVITGPNDPNGYGWLFQWGRRADGHQYTTWGSQPSPALSSEVAATASLSSSDIVAAPNDVKYITSSLVNNDWRNPQSPNAGNLWDGTKDNNPCPDGFHVPKQAEWAAVVTAGSGIHDIATAFGTSLKLTAAGTRHFSGGAPSLQTVVGHYWAADASGAKAYSLSFSTVSVNYSLINERAFGFSVRCKKD